MSKKSKKGGVVAFKLSPKVSDDEFIVQEQQLKKKLLEDKLCKEKLILSKCGG
jgi:hypothetical protein